MATIIDTLVTVIDFKTNTSGVKKANSALKSLEVEAKSLNVAILNLSHALTGLFGLFTLDKLVDLNNEYDILQNKLKSVGLEGDALDQTFKNLLDISNKTGTSVADNAELYQQMSVSLGDLATEADKLTVVDTINKIFAINGTQTRTAQAAMQDLTKAVSGATVNYQELRYAMKDVPALQAVIINHFKKMGKDWKEEIEGNKLATTEFINILKEANIDLTKQFSLMARTIPQAFQAMTNSLVLFIGKIGQTSDAVGMLTGFMDNITSMFISLSDAIQNHQEAVKSFFGAILTFLSLVAVRISIVLAGILIPLIPVIAGITALTLAIQDLYVFLKGGNSVIGSFLHYIGLTDDQISSLIQSINDFIITISSMFGALMENKLVIESIIALLITLGGIFAISRLVMIFSSAITALTTAFKFLNIAMKANPIGLIISGVALLIALFPKLRKSMADAFKDSVFYKTYEFLKKTLELLGIINKTTDKSKQPTNFVETKGNVIDYKKIKNKNNLDLDLPAEVYDFDYEKNKKLDAKMLINNAIYSNNQLMTGTQGNTLNPNAFNNYNNTNTNNINVNVNAQTNASADEIARQASIEVANVLGRQYKSATLNNDSSIRR